MISSFNSLGFFEKKNVFSLKDKKEIQKNIIQFVNLFRTKINKKWKKKNLTSVNDLNKFFIFLEKYNKDYLWNLQQLICFLPEIKRIQTNIKLLDIASDILKTNKDKLLIQDPLILINLPSTSRNLYSWHNANNYYQKRNNYVGMWIPLIIDKNDKNGTMIIAEKSHYKSDFPFLEFQKDNYSSHQHSIPEDFVKKFKKRKIHMRFGDVFGMHKNLVHKSSENKSNVFSMVLVYKYWDISKDLTLSSKITEQYFKDDKCSRPDVKIV